MKLAGMSSTLTESDLLAMSLKELMSLFAKSPAPTVQQMNGEYAARLLAQPSKVAQVLGDLSVNNALMPGRWLCKAFRPVSRDRGRGYNGFAQLGRKVQRFPMETLIAPSRYDGRPAYTLVYGSFRSLCGAINMVDEVRQVAPDLYLGIGTWGFTDAQRRIPLPFVLRGPATPYGHDLGTPKKKFDVRQAIPALKKG